MVYLLIKAIHVIFVVAWVAGLLIFPRYKLHQIKAQPDDQLFDTMKDASAKLRKIILTPGIIIVWVLGLTMLFMNPSLMSNGWIHLKLVLVLGLSGLHGYFVSTGRKIDSGTSTVSAKRLKLMNELPFVIVAAIVILAIVKPF